MSQMCNILQNVPLAPPIKLEDFEYVRVSDLATSKWQQCKQIYATKVLTK